MIGRTVAASNDGYRLFHWTSESEGMTLVVGNKLKQVEEPTFNYNELMWNTDHNAFEIRSVF